MKYCIFVERAFDQKCFKALKKFCMQKGPENVKLFCLTPANYSLAVAEQGFKGTPADYSFILAQRYTELEKIGCKIDLHIHLGLRLENIPQKKIFRTAIAWMNAIGIGPRFITFGWYIFNDESLKIAKKYRLEYFNDKYFYSWHDYEWDKVFHPMMIVTNLRGLLR